MSLNIAKKHLRDINSNMQQKLTKEVNFALYLELDMTREKWRKLLKVQRRKTWNIFRSCHSILQAKKESLLPNISATESEVKVGFQDCLDKTSSRLLHSLKDKFSGSHNFLLSVAYGFDASGGHKNPHQIFENDDNFTDQMLQTMFATTFIIISIKCTDTGSEWLNPAPQSTRFCRPLRLAFEKESDENIIVEKNRLQTEVENFVPFQTSVEGKNVTITYDAELTTIDDKDLNTILGNKATTRCPLCKLTMYEYAHDIDVKYDLPSNIYAHGLGLLHCFINILDFFLQLSYKIPFKTWAITKHYTRKSNYSHCIESQ